MMVRLHRKTLGLEDSDAGFAWGDGESGLRGAAMETEKAPDPRTGGLRKAAREMERLN